MKLLEFNCCYFIQQLRLIFIEILFIPKPEEEQKIRFTHIILIKTYLVYYCAPKEL